MAIDILFKSTSTLPVQQPVEDSADNNKDDSNGIFILNPSWLLKAYATGLNIPLIYLDTSPENQGYWLSPTRKNRSSYPSNLIVVLDLDETLLHSSFDWSAAITKTDVTPDAMLDLGTEHAAIWLRPGAKEFVKAVCERYETYLFTAGKAGYANPVVDALLDPDRSLFAGRFFQPMVTTTTNSDGSMNYYKDLNVIMELTGRKKNSKLWQKRTILIDDNRDNFIYQPGVLIEAYRISNDKDSHLAQKAQFLNDIERVPDVRPFLYSHTKQHATC